MSCRGIIGSTAPERFGEQDRVRVKQCVFSVGLTCVLFVH